MIAALFSIFVSFSLKSRN